MKKDLKWPMMMKQGNAIDPTSSLSEELKYLRALLDFSDEQWKHMNHADEMKFMRTLSLLHHASCTEQDKEVARGLLTRMLEHKHEWALFLNPTIKRLIEESSTLEQAIPLAAWSFWAGAKENEVSFAQAPNENTFDEHTAFVRKMGPVFYGMIVTLVNYQKKMGETEHVLQKLLMYMDEHCPKHNLPWKDMWMGYFLLEAIHEEPHILQQTLRVGTQAGVNWEDALYLTLHNVPLKDIERVIVHLPQEVLNTGKRMGEEVHGRWSSHIPSYATLVEMEETRKALEAVSHAPTYSHSKMKKI